MRTQENHDIFREKLSVTAPLQRPRLCHGAFMAFYRIPTVFMVEILSSLMVLSLRVHGAHSTCVAFPRRWGRSDISKNAMQSPSKCHGRPRRLNNDPCVRPHAPIAMLKTLLRGFGDLTAYPLRYIKTPSDGVCFEYAKSAHRRSAFYATPVCPMAMPLRCCSDACVRTARTSAFCNFLGHREDAALVWQGFKMLLVGRVFLHSVEIVPERPCSGCCWWGLLQFESLKLTITKIKTPVNYPKCSISNLCDTINRSAEIFLYNKQKCWNILDVGSLTNLLECHFFCLGKKDAIFP